MKRLFLMFFVLLSIIGCTICEKPFIKVDGDCCLDEDNDMICDPDEDEIMAEEIIEAEETVNEPTEEIDEEEQEEPAPEEEEVLFRYVMKDIRIESNVYEPDEDLETDIFISTEGFEHLEGAELSFTPLCGDNHIISILIGERLAESIMVTCGEQAIVKIPRDLLSEGKNSVLFSTSKGPFRVVDAGVRIFYDNMNDTEQDFLDFVLENDKKKMEITKVNSISLQNYYDNSFELSGIESTGDIRLSLDSEDSGFIVIYINGERIFEGEVEKGDFRLDIPSGKVNEGRNTLRYIILP